MYHIFRYVMWHKLVRLDGAYYIMLKYAAAYIIIITYYYEHELSGGGAVVGKRPERTLSSKTHKK